MKPKRLFPVFVVLVTLFSIMGSPSVAYAQDSGPIVVVKDLSEMGETHTGFVNSTRYEKWPLTLAESTAFTVTANPTGTNPESTFLVILLNASNTEISRAVGQLDVTEVQPAGIYYVQIQPENGVGEYNVAFSPVVTGVPHGSITVEPSTIEIGGEATVYFGLADIPPEGYASVEFDCSYTPSDADIVQVVVNQDSVLETFGDDPAIAIQGPENGAFIVAVAASNGKRITSTAVQQVAPGEDNEITIFIAKARSPTNVLPSAQEPIVVTFTCNVRVSTGDGVLTTLDPITATLTIGTAVNPGTLVGQVSLEKQVSPGYAVKEVTVNVYDESNANALVETFAANDDGSFSVELAPGTYTVEAKADGFLSAETSAVAITEGNTTDVGSATLHAGDITDEFGTGGDNVVDEWDTMTIGMNYNGTVPAAADLNNDGVINLLDLELLAANYRDTGPTAWE